MDSQVFSSLLRSFDQLDPIQLERAQEHLHRHLQRDQLHQALANQSEVVAAYPCCDSSHVIHWGRSRGQQRFRCKGKG